MTKRDLSELALAAVAFETELEAYKRSGELFIKTPLGSVRHLERANATLGEIAASEERLQAAGQRLVAALAATRSEQEQLAAAVVAHVPKVQERNQRLKDLMTELGAVAAEVATVNAMILGLQTNGDPSHGPSAKDTHAVSTSILALASRAEHLAQDAQTAELEEVASQAHALHQRLLAIGKKLQKAAASES